MAVVNSCFDMSWLGPLTNAALYSCLQVFLLKIYLFYELTRFTTDEMSVEGLDHVKSLCPSCAGLYI